MEKLKIVFSLLNKLERKKFFSLIALMLIATILEIASISAFIPTISILLGGDLQYFFEILKINPSTIQLDQIQLIYLSLSVVILIFLFKNIYLIFYTWVNSLFYFNVGKRLSEYLFNIYLNSPYLFHLDKKNSKLFFNCIEGVEVYRNSLMHISIIFNEVLIFLGLIIFL
jgi:ABC-type multidrug transport system fused ATPase/permease subunit